MADLDVAVRVRFLALGEQKIKDAARDLTAFGKAAQRLSGTATARFGAEMNRAWTATAKLGGALDRTAAAAGKTSTSMKALGGTAPGISRARVEVEKLAKSTQGLAAAQQRVRASVALGSGAGLGVAAARREALTEAASRISPNGYLLGAGAAVAAGAAVGTGVAAAGAAAAFGLKQAIDFEKAMAEVKKKVTLDPGATWADVEKSIDKTARDLGIARGETAALAATAAQAGVAYKDLEGFVRLAAKASKGWDMAPREASERLAKIKTMTGWTLPQIEEFADKVNELGDKGATTERALVEMFERSAASAKAANVPLDTSLAVTAALNSIGMQEEVAARFWNAFSSKLRTAAEGGRGAEQAAEGYKQLGLTVEEVEQGMKTNATRTILDILERLEKSADKASIAVKLFGQEWWDEAARSGQALPEIRKNLDLLASGSWKDSLGRNLQIELDTTISRLERVSAIVSEIGDKFMRWSLGPINEQLDRLIKAWDTTKTTGFLAGAGGGPIEKLKEKTPLPFSEKNRRLFLDNVPKGESVDAYEKRHGLDRAPPSSGSGANLRDEIVSASRRHGIDPRIMFGIHAGESLHGSRYDVKHDAMESSWGPFQLNRRGGLGNQFERDTGLDVRDPRTIPRQVDWVARFIGRGGRLSHWRGYHGNRDWNPSWGNAGLRPVHPTLTGAPPAPAAPPAAAPAAPGKQSRLHRGVTIQTAHFHGVKDVAALHRRLASLASRRVVAARDNALHDVS